MGADGWITLYDIDRETLKEIQKKYEKEENFDDYIPNSYFRELNGKKIMTIYHDTERHYDHDYQRQSWWDEIAIKEIDRWEVWT